MDLTILLVCVVAVLYKHKFYHYDCRFILAFVVYFIVGAVIMKLQRGATGSDIIPNKSFWMDLPFLVKVRSNMCSIITLSVLLYCYNTIMCAAGVKVVSGIASPPCVREDLVSSLCLICTHGGMFNCN